MSQDEVPEWAPPDQTPSGWEPPNSPGMPSRCRNREWHEGHVWKWQKQSYWCEGD
jgi:hypothetical protein